MYSQYQSIMAERSEPTELTKILHIVAGSIGIIKSLLYIPVKSIELASYEAGGIEDLPAKLKGPKQWLWKTNSTVSLFGLAVSLAIFWDKNEKSLTAKLLGFFITMTSLIILYLLYMEHAKRRAQLDPAGVKAQYKYLLRHVISPIGKVGIGISQACKLGDNPKVYQVFSMAEKILNISEFGLLDKWLARTAPEGYIPYQCAIAAINFGEGLANILEADSTNS